MDNVYDRKIDKKIRDKVYVQYKSKEKNLQRLLYYVAQNQTNIYNLGNDE